MADQVAAPAGETGRPASPRSPTSSAQPLRWTPEEIGRLWAYYSSRNDQASFYFTASNGEAIIRLFEFARPLRGLEVLDYGCGPGFLDDHLLRAGARVAATDLSEEAVNRVGNRLSGEAGWLGARVSSNRLPWPDESFDAVFCVEVVEHLDDEAIRSMLPEIRRVLRADGLAFFSTPNEEALSGNAVYCPRCEAEFHRFGHLRNWSAASFRERLEEANFGVAFCSGVDLARFEEPVPRAWDQVSLADLRRGIGEFLAGMRDRLTPRAFPDSLRFRRRLASPVRPHLVAVAAKQVSNP